jgi:hypothetical protein
MQKFFNLLTEKWKSTLLFLIVAFFFACNSSTEPPIPVFQEAIYIMDADGSNKTKVIDVSGCDNVQFIPNSDKLLYLAKNSLYTVKIDGTENQKISGNINCYYARPVVSDDGIYCFFEGYEERMEKADIYQIDLVQQLVNVIVNTTGLHENNICYKDDYLVFLSINDNRMTFVNRYSLETQDSEVLLSDNQNFIYAPIFGETVNEIFFLKSGNLVENGIYHYFIDTQNEFIITTSLFGGNLFYHNSQFLINYGFPIYKISISEGSFLKLSDGGTPDFYENYMVYTTKYGFEGTIKKMDLETMNVYILKTKAMKPKFSGDGEKICFIGQYGVN